MICSHLSLIIISGNEKKCNYLIRWYQYSIGARIQFQTANDLKPWYKRPAAVWEEALPIGNGRVNRKRLKSLHSGNS